MLRRAGFVLVSVVLALGAFAAPVGAVECIEVMQHKYCIP